MNFDTRLEAAIGLAEEALRFQASGGVIPRCAITAGISGLMHCGDDQTAALQLCVLREIRVALEFVVAPALTADVVGPPGGIRGRAIGAVELIAPDELEASSRRRLERRTATTTQR